jgi:cobalamin-dependent methionine synthase I
VDVNGLSKLEVHSDDEAKCIAHEMANDEKNYPVVYTASNTTGEKAYEEFYVPGEQVNMERFMSLGVVEQTERRSMNEVVNFFDELQQIFASPIFTKAEVVTAIKAFLPNFEHEEKGKNLDQKM